MNMRRGTYDWRGIPTRNDRGIFAVKVVVACVLMNYYLGGLPVLMFLAGWWWGGRNDPRDDEEIPWE